MKKQKIQTTQYILEEKDVEILRDLLNYCWHRSTQHESPISNLRDEISKLRFELGICTKIQ
jgi:hypothetical protein